MCVWSKAAIMGGTSKWLNQTNRNQRGRFFKENYRLFVCLGLQQSPTMQLSYYGIVLAICVALQYNVQCWTNDKNVCIAV